MRPPSDVWPFTTQEFPVVDDFEAYNGDIEAESVRRTEVFGNRREAKVLVENYRRRYNHYRPHSSLNYATPAAFAAACLAAASAGPAPTPNREEVADSLT